MNEIRVYHNPNDSDNWQNSFESTIFSSQLKYLASDLFNEGLTISNINEATKRAIKIAKSAGVDIRKHFMPIYTGRGGQIYRDCKTSRLGLGLILLNANPNLDIVGKWQMKLLENYFQ